MRRHIFLLFLFPSLIYAQLDSIKGVLNYYPLQTGNYWEYISYFEQIPFPISDSSFCSVEVIGDTILDNGHNYKILSNKFIYPNQYQSFNYERVDSTTGCVYRYINDTTLGHEYMSDSLFADQGDTIYSARERITTFGYYRTICLSIKIDSVFGYITQVKEFYNQSFIPGGNYALAKGIGFLFSQSCEFGCGFKNLVYAKVDGREFGNKIMEVKNNNNILSLTFNLYQNFPNPFNPITKISWQSPQSGWQTLKVYDILGREVATLVDEFRPAGNYKVNFDASNLPSGVYLYKLQAGSFVETKKMILMR